MPWTSGPTPRSSRTNLTVGADRVQTGKSQRSVLVLVVESEKRKRWGKQQMEGLIISSQTLFSQVGTGRARTQAAATRPGPRCVRALSSSSSSTSSTWPFPSTAAEPLAGDACFLPFLSFFFAFLSFFFAFLAAAFSSASAAFSAAAAASAAAFSAASCSAASFAAASSAALASAFALALAEVSDPGGMTPGGLSLEARSRWIRVRN